MHLESISFCIVFFYCMVFPPSVPYELEFHSLVGVLSSLSFSCFKGGNYVLSMTLEGHGAAVNVLEFDENYIISASGDRTIR